MFVKRDGAGRRIFWGVHGWSGDHRTFAPLIGFLPADATFYSVDLPGYGRSKPPAAWTLSSLAEELADEIARHGAGPATLIGNCSGAILGLAALPKMSALIERLVLIDPFAYVPWYFKVFVSPPIGRYAYYSTFANPIGRWITNRSLKSRRAEETDLTGSFRAVDHRVSYRYLQLLTEIDGVARFAGIRHPIDLVHGSRTFDAIKKSAQMWREIWPQAQVYELAGAGHLPILEATEELSQIIFSAID